MKYMKILSAKSDICNFIFITAVHPCTLQLVNLSKLDDVSLKRYWRVFQLPEPTDPRAPKEELIVAIRRHFTTQVWLSSNVVDTGLVCRLIVANGRHSTTQVWLSITNVVKIY